MRITDFLVADAINVDLKSQNKKDVLGELLQPLAKAGKIADAKKMVDVLLEREELGSTGIGGRIAIPHGKATQVKELAASLGISKA
ncbi:MAG TPA: PTS sugar transporter subunit IIA, partial [bacterium]|nr:PTS sugar transporter subunit IIA [bacterium]